MPALIVDQRIQHCGHRFADRQEVTDIREIIMQKFDYSIRNYVDADLPALQAIRAAAFGPVFASFRELAGRGVADTVYSPKRAETGQANHLAHMCEPQSAHRVLVAEASGVPIGFCGVTCDRANQVGEIGLNAVDPEFASHGVGTALYRRALEVMREQGMTSAVVATGGDHSHAPARTAYGKAGFDRAIPSVLLLRNL